MRTVLVLFCLILTANARAERCESVPAASANADPILVAIARRMSVDVALVRSRLGYAGNLDELERRFPKTVPADSNTLLTDNAAYAMAEMMFNVGAPPPMFDYWIERRLIPPSRSNLDVMDRPPLVLGLIGSADQPIRQVTCLLLSDRKDYYTDCRPMDPNVTFERVVVEPGRVRYHVIPRAQAQPTSLADLPDYVCTLSELGS